MRKNGSWNPWGEGLQQKSTHERERMPLRREKEDYSGWAPSSTKGWQLKPPRREKDYSTNQHERLTVETPEGEKDYSRWAPTSMKGWQLKPLKRVEIRVLQYTVHGTTVCEGATPTVSTVFHPSQDVKTWPHWIHWHAPLVQKDFLASISTLSLMNSCLFSLCLAITLYIPCVEFQFYVHYIQLSC